MAILDNYNIEQQLELVYVGYYNRGADTYGLKFWQDEYALGLTVKHQSASTVLDNIANAFAPQPETAALYPLLGNTLAPLTPEAVSSFLTSVYANLFNRQPDTAGFNYWSNQILTGKVGLGEAVLVIANGATGNDLILLQNKVTAALNFTHETADAGLGVSEATTNQAFLDEAHTVLGLVTTNPASLVVAAASVTAFIASGDGWDPVTFTLTPAIDLLDTRAADNVVGNNTTFTPGDNIKGDAKIELFMGASNETFATQTIDGSDLVAISTAVGAPTLVTSQWKNVNNVLLDKSTGSVTFNDLQASTNDAATGAAGTTYWIKDFVTANTATFNFDAQAVDGADTQVNLRVKEVTGNVVLNGGNIETASIAIDDVEGEESHLASLSVQGIKTLELTGGKAGIDFSIDSPLNAGLVKIDASTVSSNLTLNVSNSTEAMNILLGSGDDTLITGDTLGSAAAQDTIDGGEGADLVTAVFTTAGTRQPAMTNVEEMTVTFNAAATVDFRDTDDLATINVLSSSDRISFRNMDSTVSEINVSGNQASNQAHRLFFDKGGDVTVNWTNQTATDPNAGELIFQDVRGVNFVHSGPFDTFFDDVVGDGNDAVFSFDDSLKTLSITNNGPGDLYLLGGNGDEAVAGTRNMTDLTIAGKDGDIAISGDIDTIRNLENLTITADNGSYVALDDIGSGFDAINGGTGYGLQLDNVLIKTGSGNSTTVEFDDLRADDSFISTVTIEAGNSSQINIDRIVAQSISDMTVTLAEDSNLSWNNNNPFDIDMNIQGDSLVVKGSGSMSQLDFGDEAFAKMDFSGLSTAVDVRWLNDDSGSNVIGTGADDTFLGGRGNDVIHGGSGNDFIAGNNGADTLFGEEGIDTVYGGRGLDNITLGGGNDLAIVGFVGPNADIISDFVSGADDLQIDISDFETGGIDLVRGDSGSVGAGNAPTWATINGQVVTTAGPYDNANLFQITGTYANAAALEAAIQGGGSRQIATSFLNAFDFEVNDALAVVWSDGANTHVSQAKVTAVVNAGFIDTYNFDVTDVVTLTGVPAIDVTDFRAFIA